MARIKTAVIVVKTAFVVGFLAYIFMPTQAPTEGVREVQLLTKQEEAALKHGVDPLLLEVIELKESKWGNEATKFEPSHMSLAKKQYPKASPAYQKQVASSHCRLQIMGTTAKGFGIDWPKLYDDEVCVEAALMKVRECEKKSNGDRFETFKCYNGTGKDAREYARKAVKIYQTLEKKKKLQSLLVEALSESRRMS